MIHAYSMAGCFIVLDVYSGSIHVVDEVAYDCIVRYETTKKEDLIAEVLAKHSSQGLTVSDLEECLAEIAELKAQGKLFTADSYGKEVKEFKQQRNEVKALCLHIAHSCNLNCQYCFAAQGKYHGADALMSFEVGKQALDFLVASSGNRHNLEVDFFGGEPLLNFEVVKELVAYARSIEKAHNKNFRFTLTTNGVLLDQEVIDFCNREMQNVVLSLDGRKEVHDKKRRDYAGNGSYERILPKFQALAKSRAEQNYYVRGTFTHDNPDFLQDILHIADLGFTQISMEPVVCSPDEPYALTEQDLPILYEQYEKLAKEMLRRKKEGRPFVFYHYMLDLEHGPCIYKRISGCGSGSEYFAVTPTGELYPCHQFVGDKDYCMGNVFDGIQRQDLRDKFQACNVYSRPECADCWAKLFCSGGCAANAYHATGDIGGIYEYGCKLFRRRMECAIYLQAMQQLEQC